MSNIGRALSQHFTASAVSIRVSKACRACTGVSSGPVSGSVWDALVMCAGGDRASDGGGTAGAAALRMSMCCTTGMLPVRQGRGQPGRSPQTVHATSPGA
eukprot:363618-Chlamydomonas_euryale.AAC.9